MKKINPSPIISELPVDQNRTNIPRQVPDAAVSMVQPETFQNPKLLHVSMILAKELGFTDIDLKSDAFLQLVTGQAQSYVNNYFAMNYGGHQFGHWAGQLGDGRAINMGQLQTANSSWELQLKGAGPTPYSRKGDGFAVLRSSIREHLCSEAMFHLGVPTTRSLSLALSGEQVLRDMFYDGNAAHEKGAVVCRVSPSFIRFGNFQLPAANGNLELLKKITDFTISHHFKHITSTGTDKYLQFFQEVAATTLDLMLHWQRVGFVHGVMNTDNMSILGLTIDYGPYGWIDDYNPGWTPNTTDNQHKRYRYGAQPEIGLWNLWQLANALYPLIDDSGPLEAILDTYKKDYAVKHLAMMRSKLGLTTSQNEDDVLIQQLLDLLPQHETDMTLFFRELAQVTQHTALDKAFETVKIAFYELDQMTTAIENQWKEWLTIYKERLDEESAFAKARLPLMQRTNPKYVLRNYMSQLIIDDAEKGDYKLLNEIHELLKNPYKEQPEMDRWYAKRPDWARNKPGSSQLSCSS
jgi:uncharacterized protein YdiU (UPF0061 family)